MKRQETENGRDQSQSRKKTKKIKSKNKRKGRGWQAGRQANKKGNARAENGDRNDKNVDDKQIWHLKRIHFKQIVSTVCQRRSVGNDFLTWLKFFGFGPGGEGYTQSSRTHTHTMWSQAIILYWSHTHTHTHKSRTSVNVSRWTIQIQSSRSISAGKCLRWDRKQSCVSRNKDEMTKTNHRKDSQMTPVCVVAVLAVVDRQKQSK